jgi:chromosomal replication initiation ATPase DnaA
MLHELPASVITRRPRRAARTAFQSLRGPIEAPQRLAIELAVARVFGVESQTFAQETRGEARAANARQVAMYLAHVACGLSLTEAGRLFGRDRTTVAHACLVIEDKREDPVFDQALDLLEWAVPVIAERPSYYFQKI